MSTIKLMSNDNKCFTVDVDVAKMSKTIETMLEVWGVCDLDKEVIPLPNVSGDILEKVLEWATHRKENPIVDPHTADSKNKEELTKAFKNNIKWEEDFIKVDHDTLFGITRAASYLEVKDLIDLSCKHIAQAVRGKTIDQVQEYYNLKPKKIETKQDSNDVQSTACVSTPDNVRAPSGGLDMVIGD